MIKPKKYLGQHFLRNIDVLRKIVDAANISKKDTVLEVGPGGGELTRLLAHEAEKVIAVEKDKDFIESLTEIFKETNNVKFIEGDILKTKNYKMPTKNYKVVANLPYYITSRFLKVFLSEVNQKPNLMILMVQKEVAERIMAADGKESLLSLSVKVYSKPEIIIKKVPKAYFFPPPKVDSAVIKLSKITDWKYKEIDEKNFWEILRKAFQQKRKMLRHSIGKNINLTDKFKNKRPEELKLEDWVKIVL